MSTLQDQSPILSNSDILKHKLILNKLTNAWKLPYDTQKHLDVLLNAERLETKSQSNKISLKIVHALSGKVFSYGEEFNNTDTIGEMKKHVIKWFNSNTKKVLCDFHFYNAKRIELTDDQPEVGNVFKNIDVLSVYYHTGNILIRL